MLLFSTSKCLIVALATGQPDGGGVPILDAIRTGRQVLHVKTWLEFVYTMVALLLLYLVFILVVVYTYWK